MKNLKTKKDFTKSFPGLNYDFLAKDLPSGLHPEDFIVTPTKKNTKVYSKKLEIFEPLDIIILSDKFKKFGIESGEKFELTINPGGTLYIERSGTCYHQFNSPSKFVENVDFKFI